MKKARTKVATAPLMVRLDAESKEVLVRAAELRQISVSDYVRQVTVTQARKELGAAASQIIAMTPEEQLAFWTALQQPPTLTESQRALGKLMQGEV